MGNFIASRVRFLSHSAESRFIENREKLRFTFLLLTVSGIISGISRVNELPWYQMCIILKKKKKAPVLLTPSQSPCRVNRGYLVLVPPLSLTPAGVLSTWLSFFFYEAPLLLLLIAFPGRQELGDIVRREVIGAWGNVGSRGVGKDLGREIKWWGACRLPEGRQDEKKSGLLSWRRCCLCRCVIRVWWKDEEILTYKFIQEMLIIDRNLWPCTGLGAVGVGCTGTCGESLISQGMPAQVFCQVRVLYILQYKYCKLEE